ncbi:MAG: bifunctional DNA primase/polymerase [Thainema sp.]
MITPSIRETLNWLRQQGLPPLPVAPAHDPEQYPACDRKGNVKRDPNGGLMPAFTGKNPSFLDAEGIPHLIRHTQYQQRLPSDQELQMWFANPANGIGTLGGWSDVVWIDVDVKRFASQADCDERMGHWLSQYPLLQHTFTERTQSGGWRLAVRVGEKTFTNFSLDGLGGKHVGEVLGQGRFTVLAPTIGPSGNAYVNLQRVPPVWVERLETIGLYPVSRRREQVKLPKQRSQIQARSVQPGTLRLADLATAKAQAVLYGESPLESRSHSLTYALREFYGWENWCADNGVPISGTAEELARAAGAALGLECDRTERIIQSVTDPGACVPAIVFAGGDVSAWQRVGILNRQAERERHGGISAGEIQEFVDAAWWIVNTMGQPIPRTGRVVGEPQRRVQGRQYQIAAEGPMLTVKARGRGVIVRSHNHDVMWARLIRSDVSRFRAEVAQLRQRERVGSRRCWDRNHDGLER